MRNFLGAFFLSSFILVSPYAFAAVDPSTFIKVDAASNAKCVEYYHYKNTLYCTTTAQNSPPTDPRVKDYEKQNIVFDDRAWLVAWGQKTPTITTVEYIPSGDNIEKWNELITSQFIPGLQAKVTPKQFSELIIKNIKESGFNPAISILKDTPDEIIFEFKINSPENQKQDEIQKIVRGDDGLYILHYVIKKSDMGEQNRTKWLQNIQKSTLKK